MTDAPHLGWEIHLIRLSWPAQALIDSLDHSGVDFIAKIAPARGDYCALAASGGITATPVCSAPAPQ